MKLRIISVLVASLLMILLLSNFVGCNKTKNANELINTKYIDVKFNKATMGDSIKINEIIRSIDDTVDIEINLDIDLKGDISNLNVSYKGNVEKTIEPIVNENPFSSKNKTCRQYEVQILGIHTDKSGYIKNLWNRNSFDKVLNTNNITFRNLEGIVSDINTIDKLAFPLSRKDTMHIYIYINNDLIRVYIKSNSVDLFSMGN